MTAELTPEMAELRRLRGAATPDVAECDLDAAAIAARNEFYGADRGPEATSEWRWVVVAALNAIKAARPGGTVAEAVPARRESPDVLTLLDAAAERDEAVWALGKLTAELDAEPDRIAELSAERDALAAAVERVRALHEAGFNRTATAARLGISLRQIRYRIARLNIAAPQDNEPHGDAP